MQQHNSPPNDPHHFNGDTPWWVRAAFRAATLFGPTVLVAILPLLLFVAMWAGWLTSPITRNTDILMAMQRDLKHAYEEMRSTVGRRETANEMLIRLQQQTCFNTAKTEMQHQQCRDFWKPR